MKKATTSVSGHKLKVDAVPKKVREGVKAVDTALEDYSYKSTASACASALRLLMDMMDFRNGACQPTEMVGAVVPESVLIICDAAKKKAQEVGL